MMVNKIPPMNVIMYDIMIVFLVNYFKWNTYNSLHDLSTIVSDDYLVMGCEVLLQPLIERLCKFL